MLRILVAEAGPDAGPEGSGPATVTLARVLRDAGHEVVYTGRHSAEQVVAIALQEDVDLIGLAVPAGTGEDLLAATAALLARYDAADIGLGTFTPDTSAREITDWVAAHDQ